MSTKAMAGAPDRGKAILPGAISRRPELLIFVFLLVVVNAPLLFGVCSSRLIFQPEAVRDGEWWRVLSHPFVHLTWYHLLLDGSACLMLYESLLEERLACRLIYAFSASAGSLVLPWITGALDSGLCGLSGAAHGLMVVSALELISRHSPESPEGRIGLISFGFVVFKAALEAVTGRMLFAFFSFGLLGQPVAVSHAGGIVGSLLALLVVRLVRRSRGPKGFPSID